MDKLTARSPKNGLAYLVGVKENEQNVDSKYPNTLKCIFDSFQKLARYEETELSPEQVKGLNQEIEQYKSQLNKIHENLCKINKQLDETTVIPENYHNPADVEVIKQLKEIIIKAENATGINKHYCLQEALATIDKDAGRVK